MNTYVANTSNGKLIFEYWVEEQNVIENYTKINYNIYLELNGTLNRCDMIYAKVDIDPSNINWDTVVLDEGHYYINRKKTHFKSGTFKCRHNTNGTGGFFNLKMKLKLWGTSEVSRDVKVNLSSFQRFAYISKVYNFTDEDTDLKVNVDNPSGAEYWVSIYDDDEKIGETSNTRKSGWISFNNQSAIIDKLRKKHPNDSVIDVKYSVWTINGNNRHNEDVYCKFHIKEAPPEYIDFTIEDQGEHLGKKNKIYIANFSKLNVIINKNKQMIAKKHANPKYYRIECNDKTYYLNHYPNEDNSILISDLTESGNVQIKVTAVDSRGFEKTVYKNIKVESYEKPIINTEINREDELSDELGINLEIKVKKIKGINNYINKAIIKIYRLNGGSEGEELYNNTYTTNTNIIKKGEDDNYIIYKFNKPVFRNLSINKDWLFKIWTLDAISTTQSLNFASYKQEIFYNTNPIIFIDEEKRELLVNNQKVLTKGGIVLTRKVEGRTTNFGSRWDFITLSYNISETINEIEKYIKYDSTSFIIQDNVKKIAVIASATLYDFDGSLARIFVEKNGSKIYQQQISFNTTDPITFHVPNCIIDVKKGDVIKVKLMGNKKCNVGILGSEFGDFVNIEVIE